jgi:YHS domain-containing protein
VPARRCFFALIPAIASVAVPAWSASGNVDKPAYVCMMQDMVLGKPGIAIPYRGKTYYGCCAMCKAKIEAAPDEYTRAVDPVSGKTVDKAEAFIYALEGDAYYFATRANRKAFAAAPARYLKKPEK